MGEGRKCKYADSCFECPLSDCRLSQQEAVAVNIIELDFDICPQSENDREISRISDMNN